MPCATSATEHLLRSPSLHKEQSEPSEDDRGCGYGTSLLRGCWGGGVSCSCAHPPRLASAMLQKINGRICQEDIKEDNKRPFLANIFFRQT